MTVNISADSRLLLCGAKFVLFAVCLWTAGCNNWAISPEAVGPVGTVLPRLVPTPTTQTFVSTDVGPVQALSKDAGTQRTQMTYPTQKAEQSTSLPVDVTDKILGYWLQDNYCYGGDRQIEVHVLKGKTAGSYGAIFELWELPDNRGGRRSIYSWGEYSQWDGTGFSFNHTNQSGSVAEIALRFDGASWVGDYVDPSCRAARPLRYLTEAQKAAEEKAFGEKLQSAVPKKNSRATLACLSWHQGEGEAPSNSRCSPAEWVSCPPSGIRHNPGYEGIRYYKNICNHPLAVVHECSNGSRYLEKIDDDYDHEDNLPELFTGKCPVLQ